MLSLALIGCGRIGKLHADNIDRHPRMSLRAVFDVYEPAANELAERFNTKRETSVESLLGRSDIDAVLIASATETHADLLEQSAKAGKAIFCEKPIDVSLDRVNSCFESIKNCQVPIQLGFNRRFDPGHRAAREALINGDIGELHQVIITSRDPELPPKEYLQQAGGLFRDMTIHDFDLARFMLRDEIVEVFAIADALIDPALGRELNEVDTTMIIMRTEDGKMCHINGSRTAVYGYDQRVELLGKNGMLISGNRKPHALERFTATTSAAKEPLEYFFLERYREAFDAQLDSFADAVMKGKPPEVGFEDGRQAIRIAEAAYKSVVEKRLVKVSEIS